MKCKPLTERMWQPPHHIKQTPHHIKMNLALSVALMLLAGCQAETMDVQEILDREQQRVELLTSGNLNQLSAMLSPTLSYTHSNGAIDNKEEFLTDLRNEQVIYRNLDHRDVEVRFVNPDVAIMNGISDVAVTVAGEDVDVPLRFTIVYVKENGQWMFEAWHSVRR